MRSWQGGPVRQGLLNNKEIVSAVSNIKPRSERQRDVSTLQRTYVETGVFPQLNNLNNQILYGRRGTGKSHILRILELDAMNRPHSRALYIDVRTLGSAQLMTDDTRPLAVRCVSVFWHLLVRILSCAEIRPTENRSELCRRGCTRLVRNRQVNNAFCRFAFGAQYNRHRCDRFTTDNDVHAGS